MLRRSLAGGEDILNPDVRHPLPEQVSHAGDEDPRRCLPLLRIVHGVGVIGGGKALGYGVERTGSPFSSQSLVGCST